MINGNISKANKITNADSQKKRHFYIVAPHRTSDAYKWLTGVGSSEGLGLRLVVRWNTAPSGLGNCGAGVVRREQNIGLDWRSEDGAREKHKTTE